MSCAARPGSLAYRALAHLETIRTQERTATQIAEALGDGINGSEVAASLAPAISAGAVFRRQRDKTSPRAPQFYSLTDLERHTREFRQNPVGWLQRPAEFTPPNSQRQESGAQPDPNATGNGNMAHNTEHAAPLGGPAEGEGASASSPGTCDVAKADEGAPVAPPSRGRIELAVPQFRSTSTTITRKDAEESGSKPGTPGAPDGVVTSSAPRAADDAPSGEGPAAADAPRARAVESTDAKFALFCDGELMVSCGGTVIQLKAEHVQRLRRLLGGAA